MRQGPVLLMCGVTGVVLAASLSRSNQLTTLTGAPVAPAGVLAAPTTPVAPRATAAAPRRATAKAKPKPKATATHRAIKAAAPVRTTTTTTAPKPKPKAPTAPSVVVNGPVVSTRYGPVQVQITIRSHRIVKATAVEYPTGGGRTSEISSFAIPRLDNETLQAQSARIDTVSGATYTSDGYRRSLQAALDSAHRAGAW